MENQPGLSNPERADALKSINWGTGQVSRLATELIPDSDILPLREGYTPLMLKFLRFVGKVGDIFVPRLETFELPDGTKATPIEFTENKPKTEK